MQVRRAAETLDYCLDKLSSQNKNDLINSLKDPTQSIFMAAMHLLFLKNIDFPDVPADSMTDAQISITAERYNRGPDIDLDEIIGYPGDYGARILRNKSAIMEALK